MPCWQVSAADDGNTSAVLQRLGVSLRANEQFRNVTAESLYVVPNVVHFIYFTVDGATRPLTFINYVSIVSAHRIQRPHAIWLHCNSLPTGEWWERLLREVRVAPKSISIIFYDKPGHFDHAHFPRQAVFLPRDAILARY